MEEKQSATRTVVKWPAMNCCSNFTNLTSLNAIKELKNLEVIEINGCTALKDIEPLFHLSNLKSVYLAGSLKIPQWQIDELKKSVPNVETAQRGWGF